MKNTATGVEERLRPSLEGASDELSRLPELKSPMEKLRCFQASVARVTRCGPSSPSALLSSDEILPAIIYLILRTRNVLHWTAHVHHASNFTFSSCRSQLDREPSGGRSQLWILNEPLKSALFCSTKSNHCHPISMKFLVILFQLPETNLAIFWRRWRPLWST